MMIAPTATPVIARALVSFSSLIRAACLDS